ncbi:hypothetical protein ABIB34_004128 [Rhodococcus sp. UYP5]
MARLTYRAPRGVRRTTARASSGLSRFESDYSSLKPTLIMTWK